MNKMEVRHVLARPNEEGLPPGSHLSAEAGCRCDRDLNRDGPSWQGGIGAYWISVECPLHRVRGIDHHESAVTHLVIESD